MAGPVRIAILANGKQARGEIASVTTSLGRLGAVGKTGLAVAGVGSIALALGGVVKSSISAEAAFSTSMRLIAANTGAAQAEVTKLGDLAIKLGSDTVFSAGEAADAMLELAKGGFKPAQIAGGGIQATLALAATEGLELADAATIAGNSMNAFGLKAKDATQIADALAAGSAASSASVASLAEGLGNVGATARTSGLSLQETVTALTLLDANGIKGAEGGTALRSLLTQLTPTSLKAKKAITDLGLSYKNADGSFRSLGNISGQLQEKLGGLGEAQRAEALQTLFGSYAKQAASVFLKEGAAGFDKYAKAVGKSGKAQELADARTQGTAGALEQLSGAVDTAKIRLGQELAPTVERVADALSGNIGPALESVISGAKDLGTAVAPAVTSIVDAFDDLAPSADATGHVFSDVLVPAITTISEVVGGVVSLFGDLPGPLKQIAIEAGVAALVLPRLATAAVSAGTSMRNGATYARVLSLELRNTEARGRLAATALTKAGSAAKGAAGVGGLVLMAEGAQQSNQALGTLLTTLGGAASGFAVGGPIGAAVGAVGGLTTSLLTSSDASKVAATSVGEYASALDGATGAITAATRASTLDSLAKSGALAAANGLGVSTTQLLNATLGQASAQGVLTNAVNAEKASVVDLMQQRQALQAQSLRRGPSDVDVSAPKVAALNEEIDARKANIALIQSEVANNAKARDVAAERAAAVSQIPKRVVLDVQANGAPKTARDLADLISRSRLLDKKKIKTVVELYGGGKTVEQVQRIIDKLRAADKTKVSLPLVASGVKQQLLAADRAAASGSQNVAKQVKAPLAKVKPDLGAFKASLGSQLGEAGSVANAQGRGIGSQLGAGLQAGFAPAAAALAAQARSAVAGAVAAGRAAGDIRSPSRKTAKIGQQLGQGLVVGMAAQQKFAASGGAALISAALSGLYDFTAKPISGVANDAVTTSIDSQATLIETTFAKRLDEAQKSIERLGNAQSKKLRKRLDGRAESKALDKLSKRQDTVTRAAEKASTLGAKQVTASLQGQYAALRAVANQYDVINDQLTTAADNYTSLVSESQDYAASVRDSVVASGNLSAIGARSPARLLSGLRKRVTAAQEYATILAGLSGKLNDISLKQLVADGPEAGLATARAIQAGGPVAVAEINTLTTQLTTAGTALGTTVADQFYASGISAAGALAAGLTAQAAVLQAQAVTLGQQIAAGLAQGLAGSPAPEKAGGKAGKNVEKGTKNYLKIKSPSRLFRDIGRNTVAGLVLGLDPAPVQAKAERLSAALLDSYGTPALDAYLRPQQAPVPVLTGPVPDRAAPLIGVVNVPDTWSPGMVAQGLAYDLRSLGY